MGPAAAANVRATIHTVGGVDVCRVHVEPCGHPVHAKITKVTKDGAKQTSDRFYVRIGNATRDLTDDESEMQRYIAGRWKKNGL